MGQDKAPARPIIKIAEACHLTARQLYILSLLLAQVFPLCEDTRCSPLLPLSP